MINSGHSSNGHHPRDEVYSQNDALQKWLEYFIAQMNHRQPHRLLGPTPCGRCAGLTLNIYQSRLGAQTETDSQIESQL